MDATPRGPRPDPHADATGGTAREGFGAVEDYTPRDPTLACYDHAVARLSVGGEARAHLASVVLEGATLLRRSHRSWWWGRVVWLDGFREPARLEDYGPGWPLVRELDAGHLDYQARPSTRRVHRWLRWTWETWHADSPEVRYDVEWLPPDEAAAVWRHLGLTEADF